MIAPRRKRGLDRPGSRALFTLAFVALLARGLLPAGYMLDHGDDGFVIRLCSGLDTRYVLVDPDTGAWTEVDGPQEGSEVLEHAAPCAGAFTATPAIPASRATAHEPSPRPAAATASTGSTLSLAPTLGAPLPARGPPVVG